MKKIICIFFSIVLICSLSACGAPNSTMAETTIPIETHPYDAYSAYNYGDIKTLPEYDSALANQIKLDLENNTAAALNKYRGTGYKILTAIVKEVPSTSSIKVNINGLGIKKCSLSNDQDHNTVLDLNKEDVINLLVTLDFDSSNNVIFTNCFIIIKDDILKETPSDESLTKEELYNKAVSALNNGEKAKAAILFGKAIGFKDAKEKSFVLWDEIAVRETLSAGASHTVAVKNDGTVVAIGDTDLGKCDVADWTDIIAVSAGNANTVGLKSDGTVVATGRNRNGESNVSDWTDIVAISAGNDVTAGLKADGTVVVTEFIKSTSEDVYNGQSEVDSWQNIIAIAAGDGYVIGLKEDGSVVATEYIDHPDNKWDNYHGECNVSGWTDIVGIYTFTSHTVGLKKDGTAVATGYNTSGQCYVSSLSNIVSMETGDTHTVGLKSDGTVVAVGGNRHGQCNTSKWTDIVSVSAGFGFTVGLKSDGTVVATDYTSRNYSNQCEVDSWTDIKLPTKKY